MTLDPIIYQLLLDLCYIDLRYLFDKTVKIFNYRLYYFATKQRIHLF